MTRKKILVIGANGFTGRRILDDLSRNLSYQTTGCSLHDDICPHSGDYRFIRTDIRMVFSIGIGPPFNGEGPQTLPPKNVTSQCHRPPAAPHR